ncbi:hypothetical protein OJF2_55570 [Aquisphaera giovannonii]|uniref:Uncharacterized protein n=1 Tax=Aquisphaera giovannonii TaxID=406548 RepID=A0A5B9W8L3_9BACT|nr:hypothetical protein [Aquisphaera giovannonii]QEH36972.1 hypothetical protein OJF2_55570 [Aquisphaera giovannonii]
MSRTEGRERRAPADQAPSELLELRDRLRAQAFEIRAELEPLVESAIENAQYRGRAMRLAREALERFRMEISMLEFDLAATRREREAYRMKVSEG